MPREALTRGFVATQIGETNRQDFADRLDPMRFAVIVDEGDHGLNRRSSSAWAK